MAADLAGQFREIFEAESAPAFIHARDIDTDAQVGLDADELVVTASTFKIAVALELARQAAEGKLDMTEPVRITSKDRTPGLAAGLCSMLDDSELSLRDLSYLMMSLSDNTATDLIMRRVGLDSINETLQSLGLTNTVILGDVAYLVNCLIEDMGFSNLSELEQAAMAGKLTAQQMRDTRLRRAEETTRTTPSEMTKLLQLIWRDQAGPPEACAEVRRLMALQVWDDRIASGFPVGVQVSAKNGTLDGIANEAAVVRFPNGKRYAVAVYTRPEAFGIRLPSLYSAMGRAAALAVSVLQEDNKS